MHSVHVHMCHWASTLTRTTACSIALSGVFHSLMESFFDSLEIRVKIVCTSIFEGQFDFDMGLGAWKSTTWNGLDYCLPDIRAKQWC